MHFYPLLSVRAEDSPLLVIISTAPANSKAMVTAISLFIVDVVKLPAVIVIAGIVVIYHLCRPYKSLFMTCAKLICVRPRKFNNLYW